MFHHETYLYHTRFKRFDAVAHKGIGEFSRGVGDPSVACLSF